MGAGYTTNIMLHLVMTCVITFHNMTFWLKHFDKQCLHAYHLCILCHTPVAFPPVLFPGLALLDGGFSSWFTVLEEDRMGDFTLYMYMYSLLVYLACLLTYMHAYILNTIGTHFSCGRTPDGPCCV